MKKGFRKNTGLSCQRSGLAGKAGIDFRFILLLEKAGGIIDRTVLHIPVFPPRSCTRDG